MKLGAKLLAAPVLTAIVVLAAGGLNTTMLTRQASLTQDVFKANFQTFGSLTAAQDQFGKVHASVYRTIALVGSLDEAQLKAFRAALKPQLQGIERSLGSVAADAEDDAELRQSVTQAAALAQKYLAQVDSALDLASMDPNTGIAAMQSADDSHGALVRTMAEMVSHLDAAASQAMVASEQRSSRTSWLLGGLGLLASLGAVALSWGLQRKVVSELERAGRLADQVAGGKLDVDARSTRQDEVGDLLRSIGRMAHQLNGSLRLVLESSESIRTASAEIASGNQDLNSRTEQAASSLQQAASSMEQLTGTVRHSSDSARQANQLASSAATVAARGGEVVARVVSTMDEINSSSKRIADIIGVIDGIAFQTNILALNAAVEAARAGEQGRGFAVVASEVRSLAQRSAQAAKEIKALIGVSVDKVQGGSELVADAGRTMQEIVTSVQRVADIIGEISAASGEQSEGIGQVNVTVIQLDQMTQQNAALVEQSAAAAESLKDQAEKLAGLVSTFTLEGRPTDASAPLRTSTPISTALPTLAALPVRPQSVATASTRTAQARPVARAAAPTPSAARPRPVAPAQAAAAPVKPAATPAATARVASGATVSDEWESF